MLANCLELLFVASVSYSVLIM